MVVEADVVHDVPVVFVEPLPSPLLFGECAAHEDGLEVDPLALDLVQLQQGSVQDAELCLVLLDLRLEPGRVFVLLYRVHQGLVV